MAADVYYRYCARADLLNDHACLPNPVTFRLIEWEHAFSHEDAGRQVNEKGAIVPLCWWSHEGPGKNKEIAKWIAVNRMTAEEMARYPMTDWQQIKKHLNSLHGVPDWSAVTPPF